MWHCRYRLTYEVPSEMISLVFSEVTDSGFAVDVLSGLFINYLLIWINRFEYFS